MGEYVAASLFFEGIARRLRPGGPLVSFPPRRPRPDTHNPPGRDDFPVRTPSGGWEEAGG